MKKTFYITTTIPYINAPLHIGHALELIQADVLARYHRLIGERVFFLTGVDEHGGKIEKTAQQMGMSAKELAKKNSTKAKNLKKPLNLSWDDFIRTTDKRRHWPAVEKVWRTLHDTDNIYKKKYSGLYCMGCEAFIAPRDLVDGKCPHHNKEPEVVEEENYFFRLSAYSKTLKQKIQSGELRIVPDWRAKEVLSLIEGGLDDVSFSRPSKTLSWGIPVPDDSEQTIYVWADALVNYISAIGYGRNEKEFSTWWPADVQVLGKDVVRFHAAIWPAMLLALHLPLPRTLFVHGFITVEGQKMSKSIGNVLDPVKTVKQYGTDAVRYYILRELSPFDDGDFSHKRFVERYNGDLANGLGNFFARVTGIVSSIPAIKNDFSMMDVAIENSIKKAHTAMGKHLENFRFNDALAVIWELISEGDVYMNDSKPWQNDRTDVQKEKALFNLLSLLNAVAILLQPFLPETSETIQKAVLFEGDTVVVKKQKPLFPRLEG